MQEITYDRQIPPVEHPNIGDIVQLYYVEHHVNNIKVGRKKIKKINTVTTLGLIGTVVDGPIYMMNSDGEDRWIDYKIIGFNGEYFFISTRNFQYLYYEIVSRAA